jgi:hypothetical protein
MRRHAPLDPPPPPPADPGLADPVDLHAAEVAALQEMVDDPSGQLVDSVVDWEWGEIRELMQGIHRDKLRAVVAKIDSAERETLEKIFINAKINVADIEGENEEERPITTNVKKNVETGTVKKNLLNRYRKQSGYTCGGTAARSDFESSLAGLLDGSARLLDMPPMDVNTEQREAAARALAVWWEGRKVRLGEEREGRQGEVGTLNCKDSTVIKVTPAGLRKITFFEGDLER